jgi:formylmethanofuran dehydrogenase subunit E
MCQKEIGVVAKEKNFHTNSAEYPPEHRQVHHDHKDCPDGGEIRYKHLEWGKGGRPRCKNCKELDSLI